MSTFTGFICKDCCQSIDDCAKNGCNRAFGPPMTAPTTQEKSAPTASEATLCICADPENCREPIPGRICKRTIPPSASSDRNDGERVSEESADASLVDVLALLESFRDGRHRLLDSPYDDYIETRPEAQRQLRILNRALDILRRDKFLNEALSLLGMAATRERTGFDLPGDWITNAHRLLGLPEYNPTKATVGDPHKLISRLYEFHHWVCRSPDHGEFKSLVGTLQTTIQRLRASRSDVSGDVS